MSREAQGTYRTKKKKKKKMKLKEHRTQVTYKVHQTF